MPPTQPTPSDPDEFDRHLREMLAGTAPETTFKEASAAERARAAEPRPAKPPTGKRPSLRDRRRANDLRRPVTGPGQRPGRPRRPGRARLRVVRTGAAAKPGRQRLARLGKWVSIVAAFCLLLYVLHLLGLGPQ